MVRRLRSQAAGRAPVVSLPCVKGPLHFKQTQSRIAAATDSKRDCRKFYDTLVQSLDDLGEDNNRRVVDTRVSYSEELVATFKRKTQELCDETREQYEKRLERQEAQHERQVQTLQRQLRDVVGSSVSLAEHEKILVSTAKEQQRQLEGIHRLELRELDQKWEDKVAAARQQNEQEKATLMQRIEKLELLKSEAAAQAKQSELSELQRGEKLEAVGRAKEAMEKQLEDTTKRLEDACRVIVALKTRLHQHTKLVRALRDKRIETQDEVMKGKLSYTELKGDMASLKRELEHSECAVADAKVATSALQSEVEGLREQLQRQQCSVVELEAKKALSAEHHEAERKQFEKEAEELRKELQMEKQTVKVATARLDKTQQRAATAQLQHETLAQDLRTRLEMQLKTEESLKRQLQRLKQRVEQFKTAIEKLYAENKQFKEEVNNRDASTEAWAKKLFGR
ncbi:hypothetical protein P3T76_015009 [Phytophthora citrophthora]|uniref:Uncharacterized protein n=1 Tax=Phytophthora citrophthora TaxID=4793 RepID=A0AAD9G0A2_9STRA|nr:hypothetical protein P3T76_015009 [Phytophthora citrophthora]